MKRLYDTTPMDCNGLLCHYWQGGERVAWFERRLERGKKRGYAIIRTIPDLHRETVAPERIMRQPYRYEVGGAAL